LLSLQWFRFLPQQLPSFMAASANTQVRKVAANLP